MTSESQPKADDAASPVQEKKRPKHLWRPGESGNPAGRPKGARHNLAESFLKKLYKDFQEHGEAAIERARITEPAKYCKMVADLLPKDFQLTAKADEGFVELWKALSEGKFKAATEVSQDQVRAAVQFEPQAAPIALEVVKE